MPTNVTFNSTVYSIPLAGELNWSSLSNFLIDVGQHAPAATGADTTKFIAGNGTLVTLNQASVAGLTTASSPSFAGLTTTGTLTANTKFVPKSTSDSSSTGTLTKYLPTSPTTAFIAATTLTINSIDATSAVDGLIYYFSNRTGNTITVKNDGDATNATSQIKTKTAADVVVSNNASFQVIYSGTRWHLLY